MTNVVRNVSNAGDPWQVAAVNYSPDTIYTRSTDGHGHYEQLRNVKVSPAVYAVLSEMLARGDLPDYRTVADFVRDALLHRLHYISQNIGSLAQVVNEEIVAAEMATRIARNRHRADTVRVYSEQLATLEQDGDYEAISEAVDSMSYIVDEWSDTRHGRDLAQVLNRYVEAARLRAQSTKLRAVD